MPSRDPELTATQRLYLAAFDDFLLAKRHVDRVTARAAMDSLLLDMCEDAGVEPERLPRLSDRELDDRRRAA